MFLFQFTPLREGLLSELTLMPTEPLISIHAPARGASCRIVHRFFYFIDFNSRPCERGFLHSWLGICSRRYFNSRPCERGFDRVRRTYRSTLFQFTPLREGLPKSLMVYLHYMYFNSRPCERGFVETIEGIQGMTISIHAPARGASRLYAIDPSVF